MIEYRLVLNVCFSYNFNDELNRALTLYHENKSQRYQDLFEESKVESTNEVQKIIENFEKCLYGENNISIDILIRTSGEVRLSNFCLYQCRFSMLCFVNKLWPDFSLMDFLKILLRYQIDYPTRYQNLEELSLKNQFKINK
jgi:ditrans,polycis-polyprenyl diphosphate synthase